MFNLYVSIEYDAVWTELRTMTMSKLITVLNNLK